MWQAFQSPCGVGGPIDRRLAGWGRASAPFQGGSQEEGVCPICQEGLREAVSTNCKHLFCRVCLVQHVEKTSELLFCPVCRKPCSEEVLGAGYICQRHQKKVHYFCEVNKLLLCEECKKSPKHKSHEDLATEKAIKHYRERLNRKIRKIRKLFGGLQLKFQKEKETLHTTQFQADHDTHRVEAELQSQHQTGRHLDALPDQLEDIPMETSRTLDFSSDTTQLNSLLTDLERTVKDLNASKLKHASDLLERYELSHALTCAYTYKSRDTNIHVNFIKVKEIYHSLNLNIFMLQDVQSPANSSQQLQVWPLLNMVPFLISTADGQLSEPSSLPEASYTFSL
ncbi:E3 ubiquitin ligase TRIM40 [Erinaceus europaeus]|uniref:E3 ubiquitin ligase TRIM40 n=1 Tax=Erinaceus europaeus TaxID=9365 RepID=A0A1S3ABG2_ERIEU|nr:E3 ubiquitin ligase TRIM40 [Erinaceus europaeus]